jgi:hypothetical protein
VSVLFSTNADWTLHAFGKESTGPGRPSENEAPGSLPRSAEKSVGANLGSQAPSSLHGVFGPGRKGQVHPVTGAAFFVPKKADALEFEFNADQFRQTSSAGDDVPSKYFRTTIPDPKLSAKIIIGFFFEEGDLTFVILFVAEEPVAGEALSGHALNFFHFDDRVFSGRFLMMTEVIVTRGNEQMTDLNINTPHKKDHRLSRFSRKAEPGKDQPMTADAPFAMNR